MSFFPNPKEGAPYSVTLQKTGGLDPVSWSVNPPLPSALTLNSATGVITGIPASGTSTFGKQTFTFTAQDSATPTPQIVSKQLDLTIDP
jgi:hypothetical protein